MERLMQYIWQHRLLRPGAMSTVDGRRVDIIDPGRLNTASGPDFFNAKVRIGTDMWVGDVEIHVRASDWHRHGHDNDPAYESVILHVVDADDDCIRRPNGEVIPQMRLPAAPDFRRHYDALVMRADIDLPCREVIMQLPSIYITDWLTALGMERLYNKADRIDSLMQAYGGDQYEALYITLARTLGFGVNAEPFERLARATPLRFLLKHADNLLSVEAMLFGQSGLLSAADPNGAYASALSREYDFMKVKFDLKAPTDLNWKRSGMRPQNSPHRRIALLAAYVSKLTMLAGLLIDCEEVEDVTRAFDMDLQGYWADHFNFSPLPSRQGRGVGATALRGIVINAAIPYIFAYGRSHGRDELCQRAVEMLQSLNPETNSKVTVFTSVGVKCPDAFTSQALVELRREYCEARKCLYCRIGHRMLAAKALRGV